MIAPRHLMASVLIGLLVSLSAATAQERPRIGYVFPAGGRQGTTFLVTIGGQFLGTWTGDYQIDVLQAHFSGDGIQGTVRKDIRHLNSQETQVLQDKLDQLRKENSQDVEIVKEMFEIHKKLSRARSEFMRREAQPALADSVTVEISLAADAVPGRRELRVETPRGISNPVAFYVGRLPEYVEQESEPTFEPQDFLEGLVRYPPRSETPIILPAVVNGQIIPREPYMLYYSSARFTPGAADRFRFTAREGQQLVIAASARELIPYLPDAVPGWFQATLALYDANGRQVAYDDDYRFHPDPVLFFKVPEDGQYVVEIKDAIYRGRPDFVYRIALGELPYITNVFPLGAPVGTTAPAAARVKLSGWNLPTDTLTIDARDMTPGLHSLAVNKGEMISNTMPFAVDVLPECLDTEPNDAPPTAQAVTLPVIVNGQIDRPDDWDLFRFEGRAGQEIVVEVSARRLESPLDSVLELFDAADKRLAFNDDHEDKFDDLRTHHADSLIRFALPEDGVYYVRLGDAQCHGGPEYAYRLRLSGPRPDFELRMAPSCIHGITWRLNTMAVYALRKDGFNGEIALRFKDDPFGLVLSGAVLPEGQDQIRLTLATAPLLSADPIRLCLEGRALIDGKEVVHPAVPAEEMTQAFFYKHVVPANDLILVPEDRDRYREEAARVAQENKPFPPPAADRTFQTPMEILSEQPVRIPAGGTVEVQVRLGWSRDGQLQVDLSDPPDGITVDSTSWTARGLVLVLRGDAAKAKPTLKGNLMANAFLQTTVTEEDGKTREVRNFIGPLPALPFEVVPIEALLPKELAPDVHVLCASHRFGSATVGWVTLSNESILIDCPHPDYLPKILAQIESTTGKPLKRVILTHSRPSQLEAAQKLLERGVEIYAEHQTASLLKQALLSNDPAAQRIRPVDEITKIQDDGGLLELHPLGHASGPGNLAVLVPHRNVLFAGEVCSNGPKNDISRGRNKRWIEATGQLAQLSAETVVPAFGDIGGPEILRRQNDFLVELRRRVSYLITQSKPRDLVAGRLKLHTGEPVSPVFSNWFPYDVPEVSDIEHLYDELTVPLSPYRNDPFDEQDQRPRALALIGDRVHDPAHIEENLTRAFSEAGVAVRFAFDVRALSSENLDQVQIFCILRDGVHWPEGIDKYSEWMTPDQEKAIVGFVEKGGALIGLHNCPGLYPTGGPYLELLGGTYNGHGPLERFRVTVHDTDHPIARGVESFEVADEQHTPVPNLDNVHIFLKSYSEEGVEAAAGWARELGKGRVCYLANGHTRESLAHPMVQLLLRNAINWCLKRAPEGAGK
ncbi:MAG: ThuA domain-containing protein [Pirellulaceae bacterium]